MDARGHKPNGLICDCRPTQPAADRLAVRRDFEVRPLSIVSRKALECGLQALEAQRAVLDFE